MRYNYKKLQTFGTQVMVQAGLEPSEAALLTESLLYADSRGISSHGISRLINYSKRVQCHVITPGANVEVVKEAPSILVLDGHNGIGAKIARQAIDLCIERAQKTGCCAATVRNGNHFGAGAFYTKYAAEKGMIAFIVGNSEAAVAPIGGARAMLGTNPLGVAVPAKRNDPFDLDMATSVVARGKVVLAKKEGRKIPRGWAVDKNGVNTTDPDEVLNGGCMLPFGGAKGYAISLFIDLMCSCLGGALNCRTTPHFWTDYEHPQNIGYFMIVIDPSKFLPLDEFQNRVDDVLEEFKACPPAADAERVYIPGEKEAENQRMSQENGIEISDAVVTELRAVGKMYGVAVDF
uniref:Ldh family oxidoreductase n=1 Tax=Ndongobacter massiliensis TaxID=1871025 RepID=UPI00093174F9|nr:Ldh family oxidoreductase [Ndongobacter massiliensis]